MTETIATLQTIFSSNTSAFESGMRTVETRLNKAGKKLTAFGDDLSSTGGELAPLALGLSAIGVSSLNTASNFDSAMAEISARTGLVGDDLTMISDLALQMGADTAFSANQAADAFLQLLTSGQTTEEAILTLGTVLDLAAASGEDLGYTADALTDIMAAFNLEVDDAAMVSNALAQAAGASSADIASLAQGFANVGPVARAFGMDVYDTAAALAVLSENGIKGSEAGNALKSMLLSMGSDTADVTAAWDALGTSFYDAEGNARPLEEVLIDIQAGLEGMSTEEQNRLLDDLAGHFGVVALSALLGDLSIGKMKTSMEGQASAADVAAARMDTFAGTVDALQGSIETAQIKAFTPFMNDTLRPMLTDVTELVNAFADWAEENPKIAKTVLTVATGFIAFTTVLIVAGPIISAIGTSLTLLSGALSVTSGALLAFGGIGIIVAALGAAWATNFGGMRDNVDDLRGAIQDRDAVGAVSALGEALMSIPSGIAKEIVGDTAWHEGIDGLSTAFESLKVMVIDFPNIWEGFTAAVGAFVVPQSVRDFLDNMLGIEGAGDWIGNAMGDLIAAIAFPIPAAIKTLYEMVTTIADNAQILAETLGIGPGNAPIGDPALSHGGATAFTVGGSSSSGQAPNTGAMTHRAFGGPVSAGQGYIVGEDGPEFFVPGASGAIIPNSALTSGSSGGSTISGGDTYIAQVNVYGPQDYDDMLDQIERAAGRRGKTVMVPG